jgi:hypothetical protein
MTHDLRRWIRLLEAEDGGAEDTYAYHVTPVDNLSEIQMDGLLPQEPGPEGWPEYDSDDYVDDDDDDGHEPLPPEAFEGRIFAWDDLGVAETYARGYSTATVILRMRLADFDWETGHTDFRYLYTTEPIPPQALEVKAPDGGWKPIL